MILQIVNWQRLCVSQFIFYSMISINKLFQYLFFYLLFVQLLTTPCQARELRVAFSYDIPPFVTKNGSSGLEIEIVQKALEFRGHTFTVIQAPYKRLQVAVTEMGIDAAAAVRKSDDGTYYSDDFIDFKNFAITKKDTAITLRTIQDLKGKTILAWQNAHRDLGAEFANLFSPNISAPHIEKYREVAIQKNQVEMFLHGRAQVLVIDEAIFKWFAKQLLPPDAGINQFVFHNIFPHKTSFQVNFQEKQLRDEFNEGLHYIRSNNTYQKIFNKYLE